MVLLDVNVLVNAMREDAPRHRVVRAYVESLRASPEPFGLSDVALSGALRVLTHPRVFNPPTPPTIARDFVTSLRASPNAVLVAPGGRHWDIYMALLEQSGAIGNLMSDAWYAALAIEHGCEWISDDSDFARFTGLRWRQPG
jgi:toxin-antitoxin system PIN domain toxin